MTHPYPRFVDRAVAFDVETHLIQPGLLAPPLVCGSAATVTESGIAGDIFGRDDTLDLFVELLRSDKIIVGANIPFDLLVCAVAAARDGVDLIPDIFRAYDESRIFDIQVAEALHAIAEGTLGYDPNTGAALRGRYSLDTCVKIVLGRDNAKANDRWRLSYALLEHLPISEWPADARDYPVDDAVNTLDVAVTQIERNRNLHDLPKQVDAAWALHLGAAWGFVVDPEAVDELERTTRAERDKNLPTFTEAGMFKIGKDGQPLTSPKTGSERKDQAFIKRRCARAYGASGPCPVCRGSAKVPGRTKHKACAGEGCPECDHSGKVDHPKNTRGCPECDATGLDLNSAPLPRTDGGGVSIGRDALAESGDELLMSFADFSDKDKITSTYLPWLHKGIDEHGRRRPITLKPNVVLASGRSSYGDVVQLLPRDLGVRECIEARAGRVLASCDYSSLELASHAQSCLWLIGWSKMADALRAGVKLHDAFGARVAGVPYEQMVELKKTDKTLADKRQAAKPANFGFPGGMGSAKLVLQQRKQGPDTTTAEGRKYKGLRFCVLMRGREVCGECKITEWKGRPLPPVCKECVECAEQLRDEWLEQWPENKVYFRYISDTVDLEGEIVQHVSRRVRGGVDFCSAANGYFQGLAADGFKLALRRVAREQFLDKRSALYGSRTILAAHDELVVEMPEDVAHDAAHRLSEVMVAAMAEHIPDIPLEAEPALMRRWHKGAAPTFNDNGELIPWEP